MTNLDPLAQQVGDAADDQQQPEFISERRAILRKIAIGGVAAAVGAAAIGRPALAGDSEGVPTGGNALELGVDTTNTTQSPTTVIYTGTDTLIDTSVITVGVDSPNATDGNNLFPAALGGYGKGAVKNGLHGSTIERDGIGVLAANLSPALGEGDIPGDRIPIALALATVAGAHIQFITLEGAQEGPAAGLHKTGEMFVDTAGALWFSVPIVDNDPTDDVETEDVRFIKLAGSSTAGALHTLPFPVRVFDTREGDDAVKPAPNSTNEVDLTTRLDNSESGLPAGAAAALLNITIADSDNKGFFSVSAAGVVVPDVAEFSNGNWTQAGSNVGTSATTAISADGKVNIFLGPEGGTHLIVDVVGYYA